MSSENFNEDSPFDAEAALTPAEIGGGPLPKYRAVPKEMFTTHHDTTTKSLMVVSPFQTTLEEKKPTIRLPSSRTEVATSPSSSSQLKCPEIPCFLSNTTFHPHESNFEKLKELVDKALNDLEDYDCSFIEDSCLVRSLSMSFLLYISLTISFFLSAVEM
jgi:hypothetical protein